MRINEITQPLNEVLASPYSHEIWVEGSIIKGEFDSTTAGYIYRMKIQPMTVDDDTIIVGDIYFLDEDGEFMITGSGDAFRVLATVLEITKKAATDKNLISQALGQKGMEMTHQDHVEVLTFSADPDEPSRFRLYQRMAKSAQGYTLAMIRRGLFIMVSDRISSEKKEKILKALR